MTYLIAAAIWLVLLAAFIYLLAHGRHPIALTDVAAGRPPGYQLQSDDTLDPVHSGMRTAATAVPVCTSLGSPGPGTIADDEGNEAEGPCKLCEGEGTVSSSSGPGAREIPCSDCQPTDDDWAWAAADVQYALMKEGAL